MFRKPSLEGISVAVVEPTFSINVGYVARAMANFGLSQLMIVGSQTSDSIDVEQSRIFASHGEKIIKEMKWVQSVDALRKRFPMIVGTTAINGKRKSNISRKTMGLEQITHLLSRLARSGASEKICLVFGRDTTGLTNDEIKKCDFIVNIKTGTKYGTLNISHAAAIFFYALLQNFKKSRGQHKEAELHEAGRAEKERVVRLFEDLALRSDFQKHKSPLLREALERLLNRSNPSLREVYLLMGLASKANSKIKNLSIDQV